MFSIGVSVSNNNQSESVQDKRKQELMLQTEKNGVKIKRNREEFAEKLRKERR